MHGSPLNRLEPHWPQASAYDAADRDQRSWIALGKSWEEKLEHFMGDHPKLTLTAAAALGVLVGWMVKRK